MHEPPISLIKTLGGEKLNKIDIKKFGLTVVLAEEASLYKGFYVGRVISQHKDLYKIICENGELTAEVSGKFRYEVKTLSDYPAVGDFVMLDRNMDTGGNAIIHAVLTRKSAFIRKMAGTSNKEQIVASNIDTVFICMSVNNDFNLSRLERYLSVAWDSQSTPVVVLTKSDLCDDIEQKLYEVTSIAYGVDVIVTSSINDNDFLSVMDYIQKEKTVAFIGSSGVGKSTLINCLIGEQRLDTKGLRNDDKGKHTTTHRELIMLENGGMVIDTPGMREIGIETADFSKTFIDIDLLSSMCKFSNCTHTTEPSCAVQNAILGGSLSAKRFSNYNKLKKEAKYDGLSSKQIENAKINDMFGSKADMKNIIRSIKGKNKKR